MEVFGCLQKAYNIQILVQHLNAFVQLEVLFGTFDSSQRLRLATDEASKDILKSVPGIVGKSLLIQNQVVNVIQRLPSGPVMNQLVTSYNKVLLKLLLRCLDIFIDSFQNTLLLSKTN